MPIDHADRGVGSRRVEGLYEALLAEERERVIRFDPRLLNWDLIRPDEIAADKAALEAKVREHPRRSELLDKMTLGEVVVIPRGFLDFGCSRMRWNGCATHGSPDACGCTPMT
jgi:hypothetical protein